MIAVSKRVDLREGEELQGFIRSVIEAVDRAPMPEGAQSQAEGEPPQLWLRGIFSGHVVAKLAGTVRHFRASFKRDKETGAVTLGKWQEVRQVWAPMAAAQKCEAAEPGDLVKLELGAAVAGQLAEPIEPAAVDPDAGLFAPVIAGRQ